MLHWLIALRGHWVNNHTSCKNPKLVDFRARIDVVDVELLIARATLYRASININLKEINEGSKNRVRFSYQTRHSNSVNSYAGASISAEQHFCQRARSLINFFWILLLCWVYCSGWRPTLDCLLLSIDETRWRFLKPFAVLLRVVHVVSSRPAVPYSCCCCLPRLTEAI